MEISGNTVPEKFLGALKLNHQIFPCDFDPAQFIELIPEDPQKNKGPAFYIPSGIKRLWFFSYCAKAKKQGAIMPDVEINFNMKTADGGCFGYAIGKADIIIDGTVIATAKAGQSFNPAETWELDNVIQLVTGIAQSKALTNAGFGAIPSTEPENMPNAGSGPVGNGHQAASDLPFTYGNDPAGNPPAEVPSGKAPEAASNAGNDPAQAIEQAKAVMWPFRGAYAGKTLGELLTTKPDRIEYLACQWKGDSPAKAAALLLYPEACKAMGKPVPNT